MSRISRLWVFIPFLFLAFDGRSEVVLEPLASDEITKAENVTCFDLSQYKAHNFNQYIDFHTQMAFFLRGVVFGAIQGGSKSAMVGISEESLFQYQEWIDGLCKDHHPLDSKPLTLQIRAEISSALLEGIPFPWVSQ